VTVVQDAAEATSRQHDAYTAAEQSVLCPK